MEDFNEKNVINMFGKDWREKLNQSRLAEFITDAEIRTLFDEVCDEINESMITDYELIELVKVLPHVIGVSIISNIKNRDRENLMSLLTACYYDQFIKDVSSVDDNGVSAFEKRFEKISRTNIDYFINERMLTREELELLIIKVTKKSNLKDKSYSATHEKYSGDNKYLKLLVKAHNSLTRTRNYEIRKEILQKTKLSQIKNIIKRIREYNKSVNI